jgi:hypothetical protein
LCDGFDVQFIWIRENYQREQGEKDKVAEVPDRLK